jgi:acetylglutamate kinase
VLKFGGDVVADAAALSTVLREVAGLIEEGWRFVLCHGGGPQANAHAAALGIETVKVAGRRVTDDATLRVVKQILAGELSVDVVAAGLGAGLKAVGISGVSAATVQARKRPPRVMAGAGDEEVDYGHVGDIQTIDIALIEHLWAGGYTPVMNTLGVDVESPGRPVFNINADTVSSALAAELGADHLFLMTAIGGVLRDKDDPSTRISALDPDAARAAIADGVIVGGMIPKVHEALRNLERGVGRIHILGTAPGVLAAEARDPGSRGTVLG